MPNFPKLIPPRKRPDETIQDAEWTEVDNPADKQRGFLDDTVQSLLVGARNTVMAIGIIAVAVVVWAVATPEAGDPDMGLAGQSDDSLNAQQGSQLGGDSAIGDDGWDPSMLCSDAEILNEVVIARRQYVSGLQMMMSAEGSYTLPPGGDPIGDGAAHADISFPTGNKSIGVNQTGGDETHDAVLVQCQGEMTVRDAFKLPDGSWSDAYLSFPQARFDVRAGTDGFTLEFPEIEQELATATIYVAGAPFKLTRFREITSGQ